MSDPKKANYPKDPYIICKDRTVLSCGRMPKVVDVPCEHVGACIVVHGVNDVGTAYPAVEEGLIDGISQRMGWDPCNEGLMPPYTAATYRLPGADDARRLEDDPDAVFYKRSIRPDTCSPVIPFYWGYRGTSIGGAPLRNGQHADDYGNRLDKDLSKGGGPFANATNNLPDMWNRGVSALGGAADAVGRDPYRPVLAGPGRMYFVLAAQRLAALVSMIRDYDKDETVNIIAHSQGCLVSLLAQAFLMDQGRKPADTLILTHPPYALEPGHFEKYGREDGDGRDEDEPPAASSAPAPAPTPGAAGQDGKQAGSPDKVMSKRGGEDHVMKGLYEALEGRQSMKARLDTLINIVQGVYAGEKSSQKPSRKSGWSSDELTRMGRAGVHSLAWEPAADRDNRGKVYLYFCPEDMTVGLRNVQGIGWQGVPNRIGDRPSVLVNTLGRGRGRDKLQVSDWENARKPLAELGPGFFQRVFTAKIRSVDKVDQVFRVGLPPQDFPLLAAGESDRSHVDGSYIGNHLKFAGLPGANGNQLPGRQRLPRSAILGEDGVRFINGEPLKTPHIADLFAGALETWDKTKAGKFERVDPIDAAIAVTSDYGIKPVTPQVIDDPRPDRGRAAVASGGSPTNRSLLPRELADVEARLNERKPEGDRIKLTTAVATGDGRLVIHRNETPNEARLRHQQASSPRSFHSAIWASAANHEKVTAYDIAVGQGLAVSNPSFYSYLCAVADWRLKKPRVKEVVRKGILTWQDFEMSYKCYVAVEPPERRKIIEGNSDYYSTGVLPGCVPNLANRPGAVLVEAADGKQDPKGKRPEKA
ncbi:MAG: DUF3274 domain-containing protein [Zoogloea sp.]|uniref:T6SS effector phospholipase Tle3 domain-containing protein n=1 Tax=Zoogloea sp. TaxID=49181 RepID=UPI0026292793|nr:DUF3274 domain-containing protein [Zoogloea sp.]MDD3325521.1 DUF3274 domain-containing protein [Zoogloea sp.]